MALLGSRSVLQFVPGRKYMVARERVGVAMKSPLCQLLESNLFSGALCANYQDSRALLIYRSESRSHAKKCFNSRRVADA